MLQKCYKAPDLARKGWKTMKLGYFPFDGLFKVYRNSVCLFHGFSVMDIPEEYRNTDVMRIYPFDDSIIVEIA